LQWNITTNITGPGEVDVSFAGTSGANSLNIAWVSLLMNGTEVDRDTHNGFTLISTPTLNVTNAAVYVLHLPAFKPGATYSINASVQGNGGTNTTGSVFLPHWD
jgi:hexosaminidase